jgi:twitching motility protein PilT
MAQIDKFIDILLKTEAEILEVAPGAQIMLGANGASRAATTQTVSVDQVDRLLKEIMPGSAGAMSEGPEGKQFVYNAPSGAVRVTIPQTDELPRFLVSPLATAEAVASPAEGGGDRVTPVDIEVAGGGVTAEASASGRERIERLFMKMVEEGCSDLHLSTGSQPLFRKAGDIIALTEEAPLTAEEAREVLLSIIPPHRLDEFERDHDTDFAYEIPDVARFRCNLFVDRKGMGGVFRVIPANIMTAEDLGLWPEIIELCNLTKGLVVVTGPTGSGKSTTLAALVNHINNSRSDHIVTIEDPIEFVHPNKRCLINQREVGVHTNGFKVALRAALREDPDVVLVGEMRDLETVAIAIETAETGHLVFGTLHTNTAASTVDRIIDQFSADRQGQIRTMLSESLKGVISQTLVKTTDGGRAAALEFLRVTPAVSNLIREGKTYQIPSVMQTGRSIGMRRLNDSLLELVKSGKVTPEEAYWKSVDKAELEALFSRNGFTLSQK